MCAENVRHNGIAGSVRASQEGADMTNPFDYYIENMNIKGVVGKSMFFSDISEYRKYQKECDEFYKKYGEDIP